MQLVLLNDLIKRSKDVLVKPLTLLINQMLTTGYFPGELKLSRVIPLFKSGDPELFSNYSDVYNNVFTRVSVPSFHQRR
jgi:hypothetical protein